VCPLNVVLTSIENRDPPEPDVVCGIGNGEEQVAFELVEIIDDGWASLTWQVCSSTSFAITSRFTASTSAWTPPGSIWRDRR